MRFTTLVWCSIGFEGVIGDGLLANATIDKDTIEIKNMTKLQDELVELVAQPQPSPQEESWCQQQFVSPKNCAKWIADNKGGNPLWGVPVTPAEAAQCQKEYVELYQCKIWIVDRQKSKKEWSAAAHTAAANALIGESAKVVSLVAEPPPAPPPSPVEESWCQQQFVSPKDCAKWIADNKGGNPLWGLPVTPAEAAKCQKEYVELYQCKIWIVDRQKSKEERIADLAMALNLAELPALPTADLAEYPDVSAEDAKRCLSNYVEMYQCEKWIADEAKRAEEHGEDGKLLRLIL